MLPVMLLAIGFFFCALAVSKRFFLESLDETAVNALALFFFCYGFAHVMIALFLLQAPVPYGEILNYSENTTWTTSGPLVNTSIYAANGSLSQIVEVVNQSQVSKIVSMIPVYSTAGSEIVIAFFYLDAIVLLIYLVIFAVGLFTKGFSHVG